MTVRDVYCGVPPKVHRFVAHVGSVLMRKVFAPGEHANTPAPVVDTEFKVAHEVIATGDVHPPHPVAAVPVPVEKMTFCPCVNVPTAAVKVLAVATMLVTGMAVVTVRER